MKIEMNLERRQLNALVILVTITILMGMAFAYGGTEPDVMGHSNTEVELPAEGAVWSGLNADKVDGYDATDLLDEGIPIFGDGSDGDVTINSMTTLTRDMYYNNLLITSTGVLKPNGYRIFVKETLNSQFAGSINSDGNIGSGIVGGAGLSSGVVGGSGAGANGQSRTFSLSVGYGVNKYAGYAGYSGSLGGTGGKGGDTSYGADPPVSGGSGGKASQPFSGNEYFLLSKSFLSQLSGGAGGGSGAIEVMATGSTASSGAGGSGGGVIIIYAKKIEGSLTISASGGKGSDATANNAGSGFALAGGGGGGAGGFILLVYQEKLATPTIDASGGSGGLGAISAESGWEPYIAENGANGASGRIFEIEV